MESKLPCFDLGFSYIMCAPLNLSLDCANVYGSSLSRILRSYIESIISPRTIDYISWLISILLFLDVRQMVVMHHNTTNSTPAISLPHILSTSTTSLHAPLFNVSYLSYAFVCVRLTVPSFIPIDSLWFYHNPPFLHLSFAFVFTYNFRGYPGIFFAAGLTNWELGWLPYKI